MLEHYKSSEPAVLYNNTLHPSTNPNQTLLPSVFTPFTVKSFDIDSEINFKSTKIQVMKEE